MTATGAGGVRLEELDRERGGGKELVKMPMVGTGGCMACDIGAVLNGEKAEHFARGVAGDSPLNECRAEASADRDAGVIGPGERRVDGRDGLGSTDRRRDRLPAADGPGEPSLPSAEGSKVEILNDQADEDVLSVDFLGYGQQRRPLPGRRSGQAARMSAEDFANSPMAVCRIHGAVGT